MVAIAHTPSLDSHRERFSRFVSNLVSGNDPHSPCNRIEFKRDAPVIADYLGEIIDDRAVVSQLATRSYRHANGFTKILLAQSLDGLFHLRLHFWPRGTVEEQNVHDHRFNFWSGVLRGRIVNNIWAVCEDGQPMTHYRYYPREDGDQYSMERVAEVKLAPSSSFESECGQTYPFDNTWLHTITSYDQPVTLLLEDRRGLGRRPFANVYTDKFATELVTVSSPPLHVDDYISYVKAAIRLLLNF